MHVTFERFEFDSDRRLLLDGSHPIHLSPKAFRLLEVLVSGAPRALSKRELQQAVWPQTFVEETNLAGLVTELRAALGDAARKPRFIRTVHGFGYAFCGETGSPCQRPRSATIFFQGEELPLYEGDNILGRDPLADVQIDDGTVSRRHASISIRGDSAVLHDLASKNGTFLDDEKLEGSIPLREGQTIVLGDARLIFRRKTTVGSTITLSGSAKGK
jgi:DNA-binding winged helix-turn-helix (wHTH) protein